MATSEPVPVTLPYRSVAGVRIEGENEPVNTGSTQNPNDNLPPNWRSAVTADGRLYFQNDVTRQTSWHKPMVLMTTSDPPSPSSITSVPSPSAPQIQTPPDTAPQPNTVELTLHANTSHHDEEQQQQPHVHEQALRQENEFDLEGTTFTLKDYRFDALVPHRIGCCEHFVLFLSCWALWWVITSCVSFLVTLDLNNGTAIVFIAASGFFANIILICCNPFSFNSFRYKYQPKYMQDIVVNHTANAPINPSLSISNTPPSPQLQHVQTPQKQMITPDSNTAADDTDRTYTPPKSSKCSLCQWFLIRIFIAVVTAWATVMGIWACGANNPQCVQSSSTPLSVYFVVLFFAFSMQLSSHLSIYYKAKYWLYALFIWLFWSAIVVSSNSNNSAILNLCIQFFVFLLHCLCAKYYSHFQKKQILHEMNPEQFESPFDFNIKLNTNEQEEDAEPGQQDETQQDDIKMKKNTRNVVCCCNRLLCDFKTCIRLQITVSSVSFWLFFGLLFVVPLEYVMFTISVFLYTNLIWNPLYYSKTVVNIKDKPCCCTVSKWLYYLALGISVFFGVILNTIILLTRIMLLFSNSTPKDDGINGGTMGFMLVIFAFCSCVFFLPATGWCFYTVPVHFVLSHLLSATLFFLVPIGVFIQDLQFNIFGSLAQQESNHALVLLMSSVIIVTFISISGASCSCYRFRKSLIESQAYLTTSIGFSKGIDTKEEPLTILRVSTFVLAISDFLTDSVWTFDRETFSGVVWYFRFVAILLWLIQVLVQLISVCSSVSTLRKRLKFDKNSTTFMGKVRVQMWRNKCLCCLCCWFYRVMWIGYLIGMVMLSVVLSVTKLLAIKQVREWWLSLIISEYKQTVRKHSSVGGDKDDKEEDKIVQEMMKQQVSATDNKLWKLYYWIEAQSPEWMTRYKINASVYNNYLISELMVESVPLLILNLVNSMSTKSWTTISYVSAISSAAFILYGLLKVAYYVGLRNYDLSKFVL